MGNMNWERRQQHTGTTYKNCCWVKEENFGCADWTGNFLASTPFEVWKLHVDLARPLFVGMFCPEFDGYKFSMVTWHCPEVCIIYHLMSKSHYACGQLILFAGVQMAWFSITFPLLGSCIAIKERRLIKCQQGIQDLYAFLLQYSHPCSFPLHLILASWCNNNQRK